MFNFVFILVKKVERLGNTIFQGPRQLPSTTTTNTKNNNKKIL